MASDVFISYSSKEEETVSIIRKVLKDNKISCWMAPYSLPAGSNYMEVIPEAIANCKVMIVVMSEESQKSIWVPKEIEQAINSNKVIIPFLIENCKVTNAFSFIIGNAQRINAYDKMQSALEELVTRISGILDKKVDEVELKKNVSSSIKVNKNAVPVDGTIISDEGNYYQGGLIDGLANGKGKMEYANGDIYEGLWKNDKKVGKGTFKFANGDIYEGFFVDNQFNGKGKIIYKNGFYYEGEWNEGKKNNSGKSKIKERNIDNSHYSSKEGIYEGEMLNGLKSGKGKMTYDNGEYYDGDWKEDKREGIGKSKELLTLGPALYDGEWKNNKKDGKGKLSQKSDYEETYETTYEGNFKNNRKDGYGKEKFFDNIERKWGTYEGFFVNDDMQDKDAIIEYEDGTYYKGEIKKGTKEGKGKITYKDGTHYDGEWKDDKYSGKGSRSYKDGTYYEGDFKDGKREGKGKEKYRWLILYDGEWHEDKKSGKGNQNVYKENDGGFIFISGFEGNFINDKKEGNGKMTYKDGSYYEGEWKNDKECGEGIYYNAETKKKEKWINGQKVGFFEGLLKKNKK